MSSHPYVSVISNAYSTPKGDFSDISFSYLFPIQQVSPKPESKPKTPQMKRTCISFPVTTSPKRTRRQKKEHQTSMSNFCENECLRLPAPITLGQRGGTPDFSQFMPSQSTSFDACLGETDVEKQSADDPEKICAAEDEDIETESRKRTSEEEEVSVSSSHMEENNDQSVTCIEIKESDVGEGTGSQPSSIVTSTTRGLRKNSRPCSRWGHTMTLIDHSRVVVYGGQGLDHCSGDPVVLSDLHVFDLSTRKWSKPINCDNVPRVWQSATFLPERQLIISFGGDRFDAKSGRTISTDQLMVLDCDIMLWYPPSVTGQIPTGRSGHTASLLPHSGEIVVFGGVRNRKWLNSLAVLDTTRWKWSIPKVFGDTPKPRSYHTATPVGGTGGNFGTKLVLFGGNDDSDNFGEVHVLDMTDINKWRWFQPNVSGTSPRPRTGHSATLLEDGKTILIYGGWDPCIDFDNENEETIFPDAFLLDTELWTWQLGPNPKYLHALGIEEKGNDSEGKNAGSRRVGHEAVLAPGEDGAQVLVFGGRVPGDRFAGDLQTLVVPRGKIKLRSS